MGLLNVCSLNSLCPTDLFFFPFFGHAVFTLFDKRTSALPYKKDTAPSWINVPILTLLVLLSTTHPHLKTDIQIPWRPT